MLKAPNAHLILSAAGRDQFPTDTPPEVVMVGKSNVGKSSLINALAQRKRLAYVGQTPGKTRLINFYYINEDIMLVDVPGYGFANRSRAEQIHYSELMDSYFELRNPLVMLVLIDVRRGMSDDDRIMLDFASHHDIPCAIILTKVDKLSRNKIINVKRKVEKETGLDVFYFSTLNALYTVEISNYIQSIL